MRLANETAKEVKVKKKILKDQTDENFSKWMLQLIEQRRKLLDPKKFRSGK